VVHRDKASRPAEDKSIHPRRPLPPVREKRNGDADEALGKIPEG
jgi:hypothetical protein